MLNTLISIIFVVIVTGCAQTQRKSMKNCELIPLNPSTVRLMTLEGKEISLSSNECEDVK